MRILGYLDAGSANLVLSAIVGAAASLVLFFRGGFHRIGMLLSPKRRRAAAEAKQAAEASAATADPVANDVTRAG